MKKTKTSFVLPYPPSANRYWRSGRSHVYVSKEAKDYKHNVQVLLRQQGIEKLAKPKRLQVTLSVYRPQKRGDLDNTQKVLLDSLNKIAYDDDSQIVALLSFRHDDKTNPRIEVEITEVIYEKGYWIEATSIED